jgi:hypothetical protein
MNDAEYNHKEEARVKMLMLYPTLSLYDKEYLLHVLLANDTMLVYDSDDKSRRLIDYFSMNEDWDVSEDGLQLTLTMAV